MRRFIKYLLPALLLALCLSLAACGSGGDADTDTDAAPDSFEGMVKDGDRMASLSDYGGTWAGDDGSTMLVEAGCGRQRRRARCKNNHSRSPERTG